MRDGVSRYKAQWRVDLIYRLPNNTVVCRHVGVFPTEALAKWAYDDARAELPLIPVQPNIETTSDLGDFKPPGG